MEPHSETIPKDDPPTIVALAAGPRARRLCNGLLRAGFARVVPLGTIDTSVDAVLQAKPDAVAIDLGAPDDATFERALALIRAVNLPAALFVDRTDRIRTDAAVDAGVGSYVVDGFKITRLGAIVEMAMIRHRERVRTLSALAEKDRDRADRAVIDRAKSVLMDRDKLSEADAYAALRRTAMNQNRRLVEVARQLVGAAGVQASQGTET